MAVVGAVRRAARRDEPMVMEPWSLAAGMPTCALLNTKYIRRHHSYTLQPLLVIQTLVDPAIQRSSLSRNKTTCRPSFPPQPASATTGFQRTFTAGRLIVYGLCSLRTWLASKRNPNASLHPGGVSALTTSIPCIKTCLHHENIKQ